MVLSLIMGCSPPADEVVSFPIEVTDDAGRVVRMEKMPEKIVSLSPGHTEILYALGLEDKLVGVTEYCDYPEAARDKPKVGGYSTVDIERVVEIQPDLILATNIHKHEVIPALERLGLTVLNLYPKTLDEVLESITLIGEITGKGEEASLLVTEMSNRIEAIIDKTDNLPEAQRPRVFYINWHDPFKTVGSDTRIHELIVRAGGVSIFPDITGYTVAISLEAVIEANPEVIIAGVGMASGGDLPLQLALTEPRLKSVDARINDRIYGIEVNLSGRPGPRIVDALEQFAESIHPELFEED